MIKTKKIKIGNVNLKNPFILAPLDAVNCAAFRLLCKERGAALVYSQMLHSDGVIGGKDSFKDRYIDAIDKERPLTIQLVGSKAESMKEATEIIDEYADIIDLNLGCPMPNILALKAGAYFSKHPEQIERILKPILNSTNKPVTAKIRIGWDSHSLNHIKVSKQLEDMGISAIAVHARTKEQGYSGKANWTAIKQVKEKLNIPVIGNGDVFKPEDAESMLKRTDCDAVMIARGAIGNPFIFSQCIDYFKNGKYDETTKEEMKNEFLKFLKYYDKYQNRERFPEIKQHAAWFIKFIKGAKKLREEIIKTNNTEELKKIFDKI